MAARLLQGHVVPVDRCQPDPETVAQAAKAIRGGAVIAIPTDTVYGLAADPFQPDAVAAIFALKKRPETLPILLLIDGLERLTTIARDIPAVFAEVARDCWPGPLTLVLPAASAVPPEITAGSGTIAVRWPDDALVQALVTASDRPLTGTSANLSGHPAAQSAAEVNRQLGSGVYCILDGGEARSGQPSTILDLTGEPRILRPGALPAARLAKYLR